MDARQNQRHTIKPFEQHTHLLAILAELDDVLLALAVLVDEDLVVLEDGVAPLPPGTTA